MGADYFTHLENMGLVDLFDYTGENSPFKERLSRCYELAGKAVLKIGIPSLLVHGSWHGPDAPERIDHAICVLQNGNVWEPISTGVFQPRAFIEYVKWQDQAVYTECKAMSKMLEHEHFGPWHTEKH